MRIRIRILILIRIEIKGFGDMMPLFLFIFILYITFIHSITFMWYIHPSSFAEVPLYLLIAGQQWEKPPRGAEPRIELGPTLQQADAQTTEPRRTLLSHAAPCLSHAARCDGSRLAGPGCGSGSGKMMPIRPNPIHITLQMQRRPFLFYLVYLTASIATD
jgi:hypothetical protein